MKEKTQSDYILEAKKVWQRAAEFDGPIQEIEDHNPMIHHIIEAYARGHIVTKEEALSQMVVQLSKNWKDEHDKDVTLMNYTAMPPIIRPSPFH